MLSRRSLLPFIALCLTFSGFSAIEDEEAKFIGTRGKYWAFQKVTRPETPPLTDPWIKTPVDGFILAALRSKGLQPSAPADRVKLIRRVTLDLTGLLPTPGEVKEFLQ